MAVVLKHVKPEHVEILAQYIPLDSNNEGIALIFDPQVQNQLNEAGFNDGETVPYEFGGDADVWLESVNSTEHCLVATLLDPAA